MSLKLKDENEILHSFDKVMENDLNVVNEFALIASNIRTRVKREFSGILYSFLSFKKTCFLSCFLNLRFKNLYIFICWKRTRIGIV
jgi:hypothetical protein